MASKIVLVAFDSYNAAFSRRNLHQYSQLVVVLCFLILTVLVILHDEHVSIFNPNCNLSFLDCLGLDYQLHRCYVYRIHLGCCLSLRGGVSSYKCKGNFTRIMLVCCTHWSAVSACGMSILLLSKIILLAQFFHTFLGPICLYRCCNIGNYQLWHLLHLARRNKKCEFG
jgi:hypothetical protein